MVAAFWRDIALIIVFFCEAFSYTAKRNDWFSHIGEMMPEETLDARIRILLWHFLSDAICIFSPCFR